MDAIWPTSDSSPLFANVLKTEPTPQTGLSCLPQPEGQRSLTDGLNESLSINILESRQDGQN